MAMQPVPLDKASRLLNHGPTVLVGSAHAGRINVMAAAWAMPLDFDPPKVAVVIDKATLSRQLIDASGVLSVCVPCVAQADLTRAVGGESGKDHPDKLQRCGVAFEPGPQTACPLVQGAIAWMECRVLPATAHVVIGDDAKLEILMGRRVGAATIGVTTGWGFLCDRQARHTGSRPSRHSVNTDVHQRHSLNLGSTFDRHQGSRCGSGPAEMQKRLPKEPLLTRR